VDWLQRGDQAAAALATHDYQCVLLDRSLPGLDGDAVLQALRAAGAPRSQLPVIVITARDTLADRIQGLDLGADDYLVKPFDLEELSARVRAALRRSAPQHGPELRHATVALDPAAKRVTRDGEPITLTAREFAVLQALMRRPTHILSRAQLEEALYGWGEEVESNTIEVHVSNLRKKLGSRFIVTVRNQGYGLAPA
jgi:two-component system OmpR family response regulator/two-component system response regulator QseB